jgi:hypothetical protein
MTKIKDARQAEDMVRSLYPNPILDPSPCNIETHKQGYTWVVTYDIQTVMRVEKHRVHINSQTGNMVRIK